MTREEAIIYLRKSGYSRRISSKLADIALLQKTNNAFANAVRKALERVQEKKS